MRIGGVLLLLALGCSADTEPVAPSPSKSCDSGLELRGDACIARLDRCAEGEVGKLGGGCSRVGVPECASGFQQEASGGCSPILPTTPCADGSIAVPGDKACRALTDCGPEPWGNIPVDAGTLYVDSAVSTTGDGTKAMPFKTIGEAVAAATAGRTVAIAAGKYKGPIKLTRAIKMYGRCPSKVEIAGDGTATSVLEVTAAAEVSGIAITGAGIGVLGYNAEGVVLDSLWLHDLNERGIDIEAPSRKTAAVVRNVVIQRASRVGIFVLGADVTIEKSAVHDTALLGGTGMGILAQLDPRSRSAASLRVRGSLVAGGFEGGVVSTGSRAEVETSIIRDVRSPGSTKPGVGVGAQYDSKASVAAEVVVRNVTIERAEGVAANAIRSKLTLDRVTLRDVLSKQKTFGIGVEVTKGSTLTMSDSLIHRVRAAAVNVRGSKGTIERTAIRDVLPQESDKAFGLAISIAPDDPNQFLSEMILREVAIDRVKMFGVGVYGSTVELERVFMRDIAAQESDGRFGDGIAATAFEVTPGDGDTALGGAVKLSTVLVDKAARAGVLVAGANLSARASVLSCSAFPLQVGRWISTFGGSRVLHDFALDDQGGNGCGCGNLTACRAASDDLEPAPAGIR